MDGAIPTLTPRPSGEEAGEARESWTQTEAVASAERCSRAAPEARGERGERKLSSCPPANGLAHTPHSSQGSTRVRGHLRYSQQ